MTEIPQTEKKINEITKTCELYVEGMHCAACEILVEDKIASNDNVGTVRASLSNNKVKIEFKKDTDIHNIIPELNRELEKHGYTLNIMKGANSKDISNIRRHAGLISLSLIGIFIALQQLGLANVISGEKIGYTYIFIIGVLASLSTCMAVVGGLVLTISANYAKSSSSATAQLAGFHVARLVSFFIFGGMIGYIGAAFHITPFVYFFMNTVLFVIMLILGINMAELSPTFGKYQFRIPSQVGRYILKLQNDKSSITPVLLGASTFFLPCGFTQSMQFYSITTGSFLNGALTMLVFALGTLPILGGISIISEKLSKGINNKLFYITSGYLIIFFAILNFYGALTAAGVINPLFSL